MDSNTWWEGRHIWKGIDSVALEILMKVRINIVTFYNFHIGDSVAVCDFAAVT
jgi:hypothetical protein